MTQSVIYSRDDVTRFVKDALLCTGAKPDHASVMAELLVSADYRGHYSHGLNRLDMYLNDVKSGTTNGNAEPCVIKENVATAFVDGCNALGPVVGKFCMDLAIKKAKEIGVGWVVAKGSNHFGIAGWYSLRAVEEGLLGMAFTNTSPVVVPTGAKKPVLGTNPLTLAAPSTDTPFLLDMATCTAALGKIEMQKRLGNKTMPVGWGVDSEGQPSVIPDEVLSNGGLSPLGGSAETAGYKGYGLATMVEVFCGILSGSHWGPHIRDWRSTDKIANLGQCFVAINPDMFAPDFPVRMSNLMTCLRELEPITGGPHVQVAGDPELEHMAKCDQLGGIPYHENQANHMAELAEKYKIRKLADIST